MTEWMDAKGGWYKKPVMYIRSRDIFRDGKCIEHRPIVWKVNERYGGNFVQTRAQAAALLWGLSGA